MRYTVSLTGSDESGYNAECSELGLSGSGLSPQNALDALRDSIRFNIEYCPCSSVEDGDITLDVM